jgi:RNA polymerase sigma-70 factor (ECF subfamily)
METAERLGETELLARARSGDAESFSLLCVEVQDRLYRRALALCRNEAQALDLTQETLIAAWKSVDRFQGGCQFITWLCSIMLHRHYSWIRKEKWQRLVELFSSDEKEQAIAETPDRQPGPASALELSEQARRVIDSIQSLPLIHREVLFLRFYNGESIEGIAAALRRSPGTVKSRLFHGLEKLRKMRILKEELS